LENSRIHKCLNALSERLNADSKLLVQKLEGIKKEVSFYFSETLTETEIDEFCIKYQVMFPEDYKEFMLLYNGAKLFYDDFDRSGVIILSLEQIGNAINDFQISNDSFPIVLIPNFGYLYIDLELWEMNDGNYLVWKAFDSYDGLDICSNFELWLDRLIVSQGEVFWDWF
jgi:hypothetical protein